MIGIIKIKHFDSGSIKVQNFHMLTVSEMVSLLDATYVFALLYSLIKKTFRGLYVIVQ